MIIGEHVSPLKLAGLIEAAHMPVLVVLIPVLNCKEQPYPLRPSVCTRVTTALAGLFFAVFAVIYMLQLMRLLKLEQIAGIMNTQ